LCGAQQHVLHPLLHQDALARPTDCATRHRSNSSHCIRLAERHEQRTSIGTGVLCCANDARREMQDLVDVVAFLLRIAAKLRHTRQHHGIMARNWVKRGKRMKILQHDLCRGALPCASSVGRCRACLVASCQHSWWVRPAAYRAFITGLETASSACHSARVSLVCWRCSYDAPALGYRTEASAITRVEHVVLCCTHHRQATARDAAPPCHWPALRRTSVKGQAPAEEGPMQRQDAQK
jgi:hypothetical protein